MIESYGNGSLRGSFSGEMMFVACSSAFIDARNAKASEASANKPVIEMHFFQLGIMCQSHRIVESLTSPGSGLRGDDSSYIVLLTFGSRILTTPKGRRQSCDVLMNWGFEIESQWHADVLIERKHRESSAPAKSSVRRRKVLVSQQLFQRCACQPLLWVCSVIYSCFFASSTLPATCRTLYSET